MKFDLVIVGAGLGSRAGGDKLKFSIRGDTVLERTVSAFSRIENVEKIILVLKENDLPLGEKIKAKLNENRLILTTGGTTRAQSVRRGLSLCTSKGVLVHDGARPYVDEPLVYRVMESVEKYDSGIPSLPLADSVRQVENGQILGDFDRDKLQIVQTPQGFLLEDLLKSYENGLEFTDESLLYTSVISPAHVVEGSERNVKLTTSGDFTSLNARVGIGYDLHKLALFRKFMLGGVEIAYEYGAVAHSDGDVIIHALIDAILGAIGERDIGTLFPDDDPKYLDIDSSIMLSEVMDICKAKNFKVASANVICILEKPKIGEYIPVMRVKLARILGISMENVTISAKTNEGLGQIGAGEAVSAYATVTIV